MAKLISNIIPQFIHSTTGTVLASGSLTFYQAGTTTLTDVYPTLADAIAETNALPNPITLNSNGLPQNGSGNVTPIAVKRKIKLVIKNSSGSTIETIDNFDPDFNITDANGNEILVFSSTANAV